MRKQKFGIISAITLLVLFMIGLGGFALNGSYEIKNAQASFGTTKTELESTKHDKLELEKKLEKVQSEITKLEKEKQDISGEHTDFESQKYIFAQNYEKQITDLEKTIKDKNSSINDLKDQVSKLETLKTTQIPAINDSNQNNNNPEKAKNIYYKSCEDVQKAKKSPLYIGQLGYRPELDPNADGIACK